MKRLFFLLCSVFLLWIAIGCQNKEDALSPVEIAGPRVFDNTPLGIKQKEMNQKYGVIFDYKWNRYAFARNAVADPAREEDVLPYIEIMEELFYKALDTVAGESQFVIKETPLTIFLIGSGINYGGAESFGEGTVGQAGNIQPNRLTLGGLNEFSEVLRRPNADAAFLRMIYDQSVSSNPGQAGLIGFIYHEYAHYIDSKRQIPTDFDRPSKIHYLRGTNAYERISASDAYAKGFFIPYGMQNEHEDFATYVQIKVWKTPQQIAQQYLTSEIGRTKSKMVDDYFNNLGLSLEALQAYLQTQAVKDRLLAIKRKYE